MIKTSTQTNTIRQILNDVDFDWDVVIQRNQVWNNKKQSKLIHSVLYGFPIPPIFVQQKEKFIVLDGKQRLTTIYDFFNNKLKLTKDIKAINGEEIKGKTFAELPKKLQNAFLDYTIDLYLINKITDEQRDEIFRRFNNGEPLTKYEILRSEFYGLLLDQVEDICNKTFFANLVNLPLNSRKRMADQQLVIQTVSLLEGRNTGFSSKEVEDYIKELKDKNIPEEILKTIGKTERYLTNVFKDVLEEPIKPEKSELEKQKKRKPREPELEGCTEEERKQKVEEYNKKLKEYQKEVKRVETINKEKLELYKQQKKEYSEAKKALNSKRAEYNKYLKRVHVPILFLVASKAKDLITPDDFMDWIKTFFEENEKGTKYFEASQQGSAQATNVRTRKEEMLSHFTNYFKLSA